jgi:DNA repair protein REV1
MTYSKQSALADSEGYATSDPRVIGKLGWRLLRALNIPPHELRGISIQIQKLDAGSGCVPTAGQGRLPFRPAPDATTASTITRTTLKDRAPSRVLVTPQLEPEAPVPLEQIAERVDLPSFSQVDMTVFEALPEDIRKELETEYRRRSAPLPKPEVPAEPPPRAASVTPSRGSRNERFRARGAGASRGRRGTFSRQVRGGSPSWLQPPRGGSGPPRGRPTIPFAPPAAVAVATIRIKAGELAELGIDEDVFAALPVRIQREQLAAARGARVRPSQQPVRPTSPLKPLQRLAGRWAPPKRPHEYIPPPPPPRARFAETEKPALRTGGGGGGGGGGGSSPPVVEGVDVRQVVRAWVERFVEHEPHAGDVALVGGYLVRCAQTDVGTERAVGVMRWWGALLRRRWAVWEHADERDEEPETGEDVRAEMVGMAWWRAFREVGSSMNEVVRKRFGGGHLKFR